MKLALALFALTLISPCARASGGDDDVVTCVPTAQVTGKPLLDPHFLTMISSPLLNAFNLTTACGECLEISPARGRGDPGISWKPDPVKCAGQHAEHCKIVYFAATAHADPKFGACRAFFVDGAGHLGGLSKLLLTQIADDIRKRREGSVFLQEFPDLTRVCPGFARMDAASRIAFFAYMFENLAFRESSCDNGAVNTDPDVPQGMAVCMYQLEPKRETRAWRGPHCNVPNAKFDTPEGCTACAVDTLNSYLRERESANGVREKFFGDAYWYALNPPRRSTKLKEHSKYRDGDQFCVQKKKGQKNRDIVYDKLLEDITRFPLCYETPPCP